MSEPVVIGGQSHLCRSQISAPRLDTKRNTQPESVDTKKDPESESTVDGSPCEQGPPSPLQDLTSGVSHVSSSRDFGVQVCPRCGSGHSPSPLHGRKVFSHPYLQEIIVKIGGVDGGKLGFGVSVDGTRGRTRETCEQRDVCVWSVRSKTVCLT